MTISFDIDNLVSELAAEVKDIRIAAPSGPGHDLTPIFDHIEEIVDDHILNIWAENNNIGGARASVLDILFEKVVEEMT